MPFRFHFYCAPLLAAVFSSSASLLPAKKPLAVHRQAAAPTMNVSRLQAISGDVARAIADHECPGAVVLIGHDGKAVYFHAFGYRSLIPRRLPMRTDTIFDMASVTKVIATTTAIMQLFEQGKIRLDDPVSKYWPAFGANGKEGITIRELMTHYSGLPPDLDLSHDWTGNGTAMRMIEAVSPINPPGTRFLYSDINFETLGELVLKITGEPLDVYCKRHIFRPLRMTSTLFLPPKSLRGRIAPTQHLYGETGPILWGEVHDPTARRMGGVAGHAGLFSDARDLSIFAQMLLGGGTYHGARILSPLTVEKMTTPQTPPDKMAVRGLGWDIASPFSSNRGALFDVGSYGHTGFTGTSIWIDPVTNTYVIVLTNRVHPNGKGDVLTLRSEISTVVASALGPADSAKILAMRQSLTGHYELTRSYRIGGLRNGQVKTGIDALEQEGFDALRGKRIGLITNRSGVDSGGRRDIDVLDHAPGVTLAAIFSPEHGLYTNVDQRVSSSREPVTGLPVYSLYGATERPTPAMLEGLDALVFDIQDVGVRFYTYLTTLGYCMEAAAKKGIPFYVLDRPDPIQGSIVEGPILDSDLRSFVGYFPIPVRDGMTAGEMAQMYNQELHLGVQLHVVKMEGYDRTDWYDETGLKWNDPSPNLRSLPETVLYPGVAMVEASNVSVGRGTGRPFELLGAPWIEGGKLAAYLNGRRIQGVRFMPADFTPRSNKFAGEVCHGVQIVLIDRQALDTPEMGVELASALYKLFPGQFQIDKTLDLIGSRAVLEQIKAGIDPERIEYNWQAALEAFRQTRAQFLLYPSPY